MKNIVLTTGYSLLTAFFLCTPPLCAQEKVLDRMTRSEARQEILRHTEIKDHVTFYHSNDKNIYVVYDLISSGNKEKMLQGKTILLGILDAFESTRNQSRPLEVSFFAREKFFDSIRILKENKLMDGTQTTVRISCQSDEFLRRTRSEQPGSKLCHGSLGSCQIISETQRCQIVESLCRSRME